MDEQGGEDAFGGIDAKSKVADIKVAGGGSSEMMKVEEVGFGIGAGGEKMEVVQITDEFPGVDTGIMVELGMEEIVNDLVLIRHYQKTGVDMCRTGVGEDYAGIEVFCGTASNGGEVELCIDWLTGLIKNGVMPVFVFFGGLVFVIAFIAGEQHDFSGFFKHLLRNKDIDIVKNSFSGIGVQSVEDISHSLHKDGFDACVEEYFV